MTLPLIVLAVCAVALSGLLTPAWPWLHGYLTGHPTHADLSRLLTKEFLSMLMLSFSLVAAGIWLGIRIYGRAPERDPLERAQPAFFRFLENKALIDALYEWTIVPLSFFLARVADWMDRYVWDGFVRLFGALGRFFGGFTKGLDERGINAGVDLGTDATRGLGWLVSICHTGRIQGYMRIASLGALALLLLYAWLS